MKPRFFPALICLALLAACATAPLPAASISSTPSGPCTDRGWSEITAGLKQFDSTAKATSWPDLVQHLNDLQAAHDAVIAVEVDPCYELEYRMVIQAVDAELYGYQILSTTDWCGQPVPAELQALLVCQSKDAAFGSIDTATRLLWEAKDQLAELGIDLGFPLFGRPDD